MKFLCNREFIHSNVKTYNHGVVYVITAVIAAQLIALDKDIELGALSFFTPIDEEAINFVKEYKLTHPTGKATTAQPDPTGKATTAQKPPTKQELIAKAKELGIKATYFMSVEQLQEVIAAAEKAQQPDPAGTPDPAPTV